MSTRYREILPQDFTPFPKRALEGSIVDRFKAIAARFGTRPAIRFPGKTLSYESLDVRSDALANHLLAILGPAKEPVAMLYRHGPEYNVAQFAVLKSGKYYASLDAELSGERLALILGNLGAKLLLCDGACEAKVVDLAKGFPDLQVLNTDSLELPANVVSPRITLRPEDYAYIIYTSGSTGPPQGVIVSHENVLHFTHNHTNYMHLRPADRATQVCPLWTGASGMEIFPVLLNGATLIPYSVTAHGVFPLAELLTREGITMYTSVPVLFRMVMAAVKPGQTFPAMRMLRLAGDWVTRVDVELFQKHFCDHCLLRVGLGASEVEIHAHFFMDTKTQLKDGIVPVGYALEDLELLLLDDDGNKVGPGEYGEIAVRSRYLSVGYWNNPQLTAERFIPDPADSANRIYLSRDIGYMDEDGCLYHVGRKDSRVKIYGKMVLINDVEQALLSVEGVKEAVVVPFDAGERGTELAAFVVTKPGGTSPEEIRAALARKVAAELVPRKITILDAMPLQLNNKINRLKLKELCKK